MPPADAVRYTDTPPTRRWPPATVSLSPIGPAPGRPVTWWRHPSTCPRRCLAELQEIGERLPPGATDERNVLRTDTLVTDASLLRKESRGGHHRSDFPEACRTWQGTHITW
ncbi:MAG: hypothetical protein CK550_03665 [Gemmatimonadetes bacterium]|nr:MAG: hypothetical protein CK550_03665 [Gemmatimonadota bacterium]